VFPSLPHQYMSTLRMQQEQQQQQEEDDDEEQDEEEDSEESQSSDQEGGEEDDTIDQDDIDIRLQDGSLLPPSAIDPLGRGHGRRTSRKVKDPALPSKGAALKAAKDGDDRGIKERIAAERTRKSAKEAKHHGKKAHAGKAGRAWTAGAGGKSKTSDKALVFNSMHF
jgi:RIO kinase 2